MSLSARCSMAIVATLTPLLSSILRPSDETGGACNKHQTLLKKPQEGELRTCHHMHSPIDFYTFICIPRTLHLASERLGTGVLWRRDGIMCVFTALQIPRPPHLTGRVAWINAGSSSQNLIMAMLLTVDLSSSSYSCSVGERKQGKAMRLCNNFGMASKWRRWSRASCVNRC